MANEYRRIACSPCTLCRAAYSVNTNRFIVLNTMGVLLSGSEIYSGISQNVGYKEISILLHAFHLDIVIFLKKKIL